MLETDYPHSDSTWPDTQDILAQQFTVIPEDETEKIMHANARALYGLA